MSSSSSFIQDLVDAIFYYLPYKLISNILCNRVCVLMNVSCLVCVLVVVAVELHLSNEGGGCKGRREGGVIPYKV